MLSQSSATRKVSEASQSYDNMIIGNQTKLIINVGFIGYIVNM